MKITRSFQQVKQLRQYEPITVFAQYEEEVDVKDAKKVSRKLHKLAVQDVNEAMQAIFNPKKKEKKLEPNILTHPNIPKPLHGVNPRTIKGRSWWDKTRQEVYASTDYHCIACGVHKTEARGKQWLEAHESYHIDYQEGKVVIDKIVPLCHYCHNFIHSGRLLAMFEQGKLSPEYVIDILEYGIEILKENDLEITDSTDELCKVMGVKHNLKVKKTPESEVKWKDWVLVFEDKEYHSPHKNEKEWEKYYNKDNKTKTIKL